MTHKKGVSTLSMLGGLLILAALVVVAMVIIQDTGKSLHDVVSDGIKGQKYDYDGDGIKDAQDDNPCASGQDYIDAQDGKRYLTVGDLRDGGCEAYEDSWKARWEGFDIMKKKSQSTGRTYCVVDPQDCAGAISEYYKEQEGEDS